MTIPELVIPELVIDAELFQKLSSDDHYTDLRALIESKNDSGEFNSKDVEECLCFEDLLKAILKKKCKIGVNDDIMKEYGKILKKCPDDIKVRFMNIYSNAEVLINIKEDLEYKDKKHFFSTPLSLKIHYIVVAHFLTHKTIVSTNDDVNSNYSECHEKLCCIFVNYKDICSAKNEIVYEE